MKKNLNTQQKLLKTLQLKNKKLRNENKLLRFNHLGGLTKQGGILANQRTKYSGTRIVVMLDIDYLKQMNDKYGQKVVDVMMKKAFSIIREDDWLLERAIVKNVIDKASGDEKFVIIKSDPKGFIERLSKSLKDNGLSATFAWEVIEGGDLIETCERAIEKVYALKAKRGIASR